MMPGSVSGEIPIDGLSVVSGFSRTYDSARTALQLVDDRVGDELAQRYEREGERAVHDQPQRQSPGREQ